MTSSFFRRPLAAAFLWFTILGATAGPLQAADPVAFTVGEFSFKRPATWQWVLVGAASMRKAQLRVPDPTNPASPGAEVVFFHFGAGQGGDANANISRWIGQFENKDTLKPVVEAADIKGHKVTRVRVESGTFSSGMPGGPTTPQADYGLYGAIIQSKDGDVFVKLTGPAALVSAAAKNFEALVQSPF